jgi:hypothetical protein
MKNLLLKTTAIAVFALSASAQAITINSIAADWSPAQLTDGTAATYINTDGITGNEEIRWGSPATNAGRSGYRFDSSPVPANVAINSAFSLGEFTHFNFPVYAPSLDNANLNIGMNFTLDGGTTLNKTFSFLFDHDETPNSDVNNCCNDLVNVSDLVTTDVFVIGSTTYTLSLKGFLQNGATVNSFSTIENLANTATLMGVFTEYTPTPTDVPEPAPLLLFGLGLLGLIGARKLKAK